MKLWKRVLTLGELVEVSGATVEEGRAEEFLLLGMNIGIAPWRWPGGTKICI